MKQVACLSFNLSLRNLSRQALDTGLLHELLRPLQEIKVKELSWTCKSTADQTTNTTYRNSIFVKQKFKIILLCMNNGSSLMQEVHGHLISSTNYKLSTLFLFFLLGCQIHCMKLNIRGGKKYTSQAISHCHSSTPCLGKFIRK